MRSRKWFISVHPNKVKNGERACIRLQDGEDGEERYVKEIEILGPSKIAMDHARPIPCGARVWIETKSEIKIYE